MDRNERLNAIASRIIALPLWRRAGWVLVLGAAGDGTVRTVGVHKYRISKPRVETTRIP